MKNRISTGALFAMLMLMAMLPRTGHSQEIDPNAYYEIVSSNNLVLDNQDSEDDGTQIFINNRVENRVSQVWQLTNWQAMKEAKKQVMGLKNLSEKPTARTMPNL